jgi:hypothetical protein
MRNLIAEAKWRETLAAMKTELKQLIDETR